MPRIVLNSASYLAKSVIANAQRCINLYPERNIPDSPVPTTFYATPGKKLWQTVPGSGEVRCLFASSNGTLFTVRGRSLYYYNLNTWVFLAVLQTTAGRIYAADNGISAVFTDGTAYAPVVNLSTFAVSQVGGDGWLGSDFVYFLDSRFVFNKPGSQQFYWTPLLSTTVDALDFASAEGLPDKIVALIVDHRELWLLGSQTLEIFYSSGTSDEPFVRMQGAFNQYGCGAKDSVSRLDNTIFWFGQDQNGSNLVFRAANYQPQIISTPAMSAEMQTYSRIDDAFSFTYQQDSHSFYVLTFPTANKTWAFDVSTAQWHERAYRDPDNNLLRDRANCAVFFQGKNLVGDFQDGRIFELRDDAFDDDGEVIYREKTFPHIVNDRNWQFFKSLDIDCEVAVGNPLELDPRLWLSWSDNAGKDWSSPLTGSIGRVGEYNTKLQFNRLGRSRDRVFKISTTMRAKFVLQGAIVEMSVGTA